MGPLEGQRSRMAGIWGGGLPLVALDDWSVARFAVDRPGERMVLQPPGGNALIPERAMGCVQLDNTASDIGAAGFSHTGHVLVIAPASDLSLFVRPVGAVTASSPSVGRCGAPDRGRWLGWDEAAEEGKPL